MNFCSSKLVVSIFCTTDKEHGAVWKRENIRGERKKGGAKGDRIREDIIQASRDMSD